MAVRPFGSLASFALQAIIPRFACGVVSTISVFRKFHPGLRQLALIAWMVVWYLNARRGGSDARRCRRRPRVSCSSSSQFGGRLCSCDSGGRRGAVVVETRGVDGATEAH